MAEQSRRKRVTGERTRVKRRAGTGRRVGLMFEHAIDVEALDREGAVEMKLEAPTECEGSLVRADGVRVPVRFLVEKFHLCIGLAPPPSRRQARKPEPR